MILLEVLLERVIWPLGHHKGKEWQQIFQQALQMAILTQGLHITRLQVRGNQVLQVIIGGVTSHANVAAFPASPRRLSIRRRYGRFVSSKRLWMGKN